MAKNTELPGWAKGVIAIAIVGVSVFGLYQGYTFLSSMKEKKERRKVGHEAGGTVDDLTKQGETLSSPTANYSAMANTIERLLSGCEVDDTEIQVVEQISRLVKKPIDWYYLVQAFGNRDIPDCGSFGLSKTNYDLMSLLKDQLDTALTGQKVNGERYFGSDTLIPLVKHLRGIGVTL